MDLLLNNYEPKIAVDMSNPEPILFWDKLLANVLISNNYFRSYSNNPKIDTIKQAELPNPDFD